MSKAPENWFEDIYADSDISGKGVPWAMREPAPLLVEWLDRAHPTGHGETALVVGCGLGDDALELARRGFTVTAFDVAATAIDLARERYGELAVDWHVGELFDLPPSWSGLLRSGGRAPHGPVAAAGLAGPGTGRDRRARAPGRSCWR